MDPRDEPGDDGDVADDAHPPETPMDTLIRTFAARGDLAHLALLMWALSASALAWRMMRELAEAARRFDDFVREIARFNALFGDEK